MIWTARRAFGLCLLCLAASTTVGCGDDEAGAYGLVWSDEFDGPAGQLPDPTKWAFDIGTNWGNNQLEFDTNRASNVSLDGNGNLAIVAREEAYQGRSYTSGRIKTEDLFSRRNGRFEARIKLPVGQGIWPAFWLLGSNFDEVSWPQCGEIDIMEFRGQEPRRVIGSLHGPGYSGGGAVSGEYITPDPDGLPADFHIFAIEWDERRIAWYLDDIQYQSVGRNDLPAGTQWVYDHPFFIILNVAVGGNFVGPPDDTTEFPQTMLVDYVRVYGFGE